MKPQFIIPCLIFLSASIHAQSLTNNVTPSVEETPLKFRQLDHPIEDTVLKITKSHFPKNQTNQTTNSSGYSFIRNVKGDARSPYFTADVFVHSPFGTNSTISIGQHFGENGVGLKWISDNLLFMRIWWGRRWGADYITMLTLALSSIRRGFLSDWTDSMNE